MPAHPRIAPHTREATYTLIRSAIRLRNRARLSSSPESAGARACGETTTGLDEKEVRAAPALPNSELFFERSLLVQCIGDREGGDLDDGDGEARTRDEVDRGERLHEAYSSTVLSSASSFSICIAASMRFRMRCFAPLASGAAIREIFNDAVDDLEVVVFVSSLRLFFFISFAHRLMRNDEEDDEGERGGDLPRENDSSLVDPCRFLRLCRRLLLLILPPPLRGERSLNFRSTEALNEADSDLDDERCGGDEGRDERKDSTPSRRCALASNC